MKTVLPILTVVGALLIAGCDRTQDPPIDIVVAPGQKVVTISRDYGRIVVVTRPMREGDKPERHDVKTYDWYGKVDRHFPPTYVTEQPAAK